MVELHVIHIIIQQRTSHTHILSLWVMQISSFNLYSHPIHAIGVLTLIKLVPRPFLEFEVESLLDFRDVLGKEHWKVVPCHVMWHAT